MGRLRIGIFAVAIAAAIATASLLSYRTGYSRGVEAGLLTGTEVTQVAQGIGALMLIWHIEAQRYEAAISELDAQVDAGISAHWIRTQAAPGHYADVIESPVELVDRLETYRRSRPSRAGSQTPHMNKLVADYFAAQDRQQATER